MNTTKHKIDWLNIPGYKGETWNPVIGCDKISEGCLNCYAEVMANRINHIELKNHGAYSEKRTYKHVVEGLFSGSGWNGKTHLVQSALSKPLHWKKPRAIFVCSMGDLFHASAQMHWQEQVLEVIEKCPQHTFLILTKRADLMAKFFENWYYRQPREGKDHPLKNLWLGVTAENQKRANERIPILLQIPAAKRFVSIEPMLGAIHLHPWLEEYILPSESMHHEVLNGLDWVIVGGESGHKARPMHPDWVRSMKNQCKNADVPFFFKQWGEWVKVGDCGDCSHSKYYDHPKCQILNIKGNMGYHGEKAYYMMKVGKKKAGDLLDDKQYKEFPI